MFLGYDRLYANLAKPFIDTNLTSLFLGLIVAQPKDETFARS